jgi:hypothetical protein
MDEAASRVLDDAEVVERKLLLSELRAVLATSDIQSVVTGKHRLVLTYIDPGSYAPSGPVNPELRVFDPSNVITTDGSTYRLRNGVQIPVSDRAAVVAALRA